MRNCVNCILQTLHWGLRRPADYDFVPEIVETVHSLLSVVILVRERTAQLLYLVNLFSKYDRNRVVLHLGEVISQPRVQKKPAVAKKVFYCSFQCPANPSSRSHLKGIQRRRSVGVSSLVVPTAQAATSHTDRSRSRAQNTGAIQLRFPSSPQEESKAPWTAKLRLR